MKIGDLVQDDNCDPNIAYTLGIIIDIEDGIATVSWLEHEVFGVHESYYLAKELIFFNKNI